MHHHPATAVVPKMKRPDYRRLRDDIARHGQQTPIVVHDGMVLDGRYRLKACLELGIEPNVVRLTKEEIGDPEEYVRSANLCRRQLAPRRRARRPVVVIQVSTP